MKISEYLIQNEHFKGDKTFTPILLVRKALQKEVTNREEALEEFPILKISSDPIYSVIGETNIVYFLTSDEKLIRLSVNNTLSEVVEDDIKIENLEFINEEDLVSTKLLYVYSDEYTKPLTIDNIDTIFLNDMCFGNENMKPLFHPLDAFKENALRKYLPEKQ